MLMAHTIGLRERTESNQLLPDPVSELEDEEAEVSEKILYKATFDELEGDQLKYDTVMWVLISIMLVLAWGFGIVMLLYLPIRRYILRKDICSRRLYVTPHEVVYKVTRPSFLPFLGFTEIDRHIPLHLVIDVIIEQGCLQSIYGIHTFRVENIAYGKAASVDELQVQGVCNPGLLRKVIMTEAAKCMEEFGRIWKPTIYSGEGENLPGHTRSLIEVPAIARSPASSWKVVASPRHFLAETGGIPHTDLVLHKLEEIEHSVKSLEALVGSQA